MRRILLFVLVLACIFSVQAESFWTNTIRVSATLQNGEIPNGADHLCTDFPDDDPMDWRQKGVHFMSWFGDHSEGTVSDTFFPGDHATYGHVYLIMEPLGCGIYTYALDNFANVGRTRSIQIELYDTLHIRMFHVDAEGDTFSWAFDTVFTSTPVTNPIAIIAVLMNNYPPVAPTLALPGDDSFQANSPTHLRWNVSADPEGDDLHFKVELDADGDFSTADYTWESWTDDSDFLESMPVSEGSGQANLELPSLAVGQWYWRVSAYDGTSLSLPSDVWAFSINSLPVAPTLDFPTSGSTVASSPTELGWNIPADADRNDLHFKVEIDDDVSFSACDYTYISLTTSEIFSPSVPVTEGSGTANVEISSLADGQWYWRVSAYDGYAYSPVSSIWNFTIDTPPVAPVLSSPSNLSVHLDCPTEIQWNVPVDVDDDDLHFRVEIDANGDFASVDYTYESWTSTSDFSPTPPVAEGSGSLGFDISDLLADGQWFWRITAWDGLRLSASSAVWSFTINSAPAVTVPIAPVDEVLVVSTPTLEWTVPVDVDGDDLHFVVQICPTSSFAEGTVTYESSESTSGFSSGLPLEEGTGTCTFDPPVALSAGQYFWRSRAYDELEYGPFSAVRSFTVNTPPAVPSLSTPAADANLAEAPTQFTWQVPADVNEQALYFRLEVDNDGDFGAVTYTQESWVDASAFAPSQPQAEGTGSCTFTIPISMDLSIGSWYWRVTAYDGMSVGTASAIRLFNVASTPSAPTLVSPVANEVVNDDPANYVWNVPSDEDGDDLYFRLEITDDGSFGSIEYTYSSWLDATGFAPSQPVREGTGTSSFTPSSLDLSPGIWYWRLAAWDGTELSAVSGSRSFRINSPPVSPNLSEPANAAVVSGMPSQFLWSNPVDVDGDSLHYSLEFGEVGSDWDAPYISSSAPTGFSSVPVAPGSGFSSFSPSAVGLDLGAGNWKWRVTANDGYLNGSQSSRTFRINTVPSTPTLDNPPNGSELASMPAEFVWNISADADDDALWFKIQLDSDGDFSDVDYTWSANESGIGFTPVMPVAEGSGLGYFELPDDFTVVPGQWYWRVFAYDGTGYSSASAVRDFTVNAPPPAPVLTSPAADVSMGAGPSKFYWTAPTDADGDNMTFTIQIDADGDFSSVDYAYDYVESSAMFTPSVPVASGSGAVNFTVPPAVDMDDGHFFWRVIAEDLYNVGRPSTARYFAIDNSPVVSHIEYPADSSVYMNLNPISLYGRASYNLAAVDSVYLSYDDGSTWHGVAATPDGDRYSWMTSFTPTAEGTYTVLTKAVSSAEANRETSFEYGRNQITLIVDFGRSGPNIDISPGLLIYDYTHGEGGGFERAIREIPKDKPTHHIDEYLEFIELVCYWPRPHITPIENGQVIVEIKDLKSFGKPGEPELPYDVLSVLLPQGKMLEQAVIVDETVVEISGTHIVKAGPTPSAFSSEKPEDQLWDDEIYTSNNPYPSEPIFTMNTQFSHGYGIGVVNLSPVWYQPLDGHLFYYESLTIRFYFQDAPEDEVMPVRDSDIDKFQVMGQVENPEFAHSYEPNPNNLHRGLDAEIQYLIICPPEYTVGFTPLMDWKNSKGIPSGIVDTDEISSTTGGVDLAEKIRNYIKYAYTNLGTRYVLLGGDEEHIPTRGVGGRISFIFLDENIPADIYFACLDGDYNYTSDSWWGGVNDGLLGGDVDWYADVSVGRAPSDTDEEVDNFVNKTMAYEQGSMGSYIDNVVMAGEFLWSAPCGDSYGSTSLEYIVPYIPTTSSIETFYESNGTFASGSVLKTRLNLSTGTHLVNHLGHSQYWTNMKQSIPDVLSLTNTNAFLVYSQGCYANAFDDATSGSTGAISEAFMGHSNAAFAYIGNTRYGWGYACNPNGPSNKFHRAFVDAIYVGDVRSLGDANQRSKEANIGLLGFYGAHRWAAHELCLMGDPETPFSINGGSRIITVRNTGDETLIVTGISGRNSTLTAFPDVFTLSSGADIDLTVNVVSGVYPEGHYRDTLYLLSNDPDDREKPLPLDLYIYGKPYRTGSIPPQTTVVSMSTHTATNGEGVIIDFEGEGTDPDGYITAYEWVGAMPETVDVAEEYSGSASAFQTTNPSFAVNADSLTPGFYSIAFSVRDNDNNWSTPYIDSLEIVPSLVIDEDDLTKPDEISLLDLFPNPFNSVIAVKYTVETSSHVVLTILDMNGREIEKLVDNHHESGSFTIGWDAPIDNTSGVYLVRLSSGGKTISESAILIR